MSAPAWTPGPWEVHHRHGVSAQFDIMPVASRGLGWVTLPHEDPAGVGEYMKVGGPCTAATARLISAVPDLAEAAVAALKFIDVMVSEWGVGGEEADALRAALAKAGAQ